MTTLSASSISTWEECHLQWYFEYVEMREKPFNEPRDTGTKVHSYAEWMLMAASGGPPPPGEADRMVVRQEVKDLFGIFREEILPTFHNPVLVEGSFELDVEGVAYTGFIDAVDEHPGADLFISNGLFTVLRDLKTVKNRPRPGKYRRNLIGYSLGAREMGHEPNAFLLDYIVRTKKPYYWPEWQEVPDEDEVDEWAGEVVRVHNQIEEGVFDATGVGTYVCNYCPYKTICGPYERWQEAK